jgi:hypothetical protein
MPRHISLEHRRLSYITLPELMLPIVWQETINNKTNSDTHSGSYVSRAIQMVVRARPRAVRIPVRRYPRASLEATVVRPHSGFRDRSGGTLTSLAGLAVAQLGSHGPSLAVVIEPP